MRDDLLIIDGFLEPAVCNELVAIGLPGLEYGRHDCHARLVFDPGLVADLVRQVSEQLRAWFGIEEPLYCDYAAATRSTEGMSHVAHADAETLDGEPNHTHWRLVTAMLYLNTMGEDFTGGELEFPRLGQVVQPVAGRLVGFRCDGIHTHAVPAVTSGERRAMAFWYTRDPQWQGLE